MLKKFLLLPVVLLAMLSCQEQSQRQGERTEGGEDAARKRSTTTLPESSGGKLDVIVIAEEPVWENVAGNTFRKYFTELQPGLPQAEPIFNVRQVQPRQINSVLRRSRNLVVLRTGQSENFSIEENKYARPQLVATIAAPDSFALGKMIARHRTKLIEEIRNNEIRYLQNRLLRRPQPVPQELQNHGVSMRIPRDFELENVQDNLLVFWKKTRRSDQGIIIHFEPIDDEALIGSRVIPLRDSLTKLYVPGEREGSFMKVETYIPPTIKNTELDGHFAIETRGLWRTEGDFMGGSFINYTVFDEDKNKRIMLDAFIYAPELNKRDMLLELEAILKSFESD